MKNIRNLLKMNIVTKCIIAFIVLMTSLCCSFNSSIFAAKAENSKSVNVKVGWYQSENFQVGLEGEEKSGYSYEYLQKISNYNDWSYSYIYGGWDTLFEGLKEGTIDVLAGVSYTPERLEYMSFPDYQMGKESYYIYQHENNKVMKVSDISTFYGRKIGAINNNLMSDYLVKWNEEKNAQLDIVYFHSFEERDEAFANHLIDGLVSTDNNVSNNSGYSVVAKVGDEPYYLAVTKSRSDILKTLNESLTLIQETDPYFLQNLEYTFFGSKLTNLSRTDLENAWIDTHKSLKIGYLNNYMPYCGTDSNGNVTGLITDVVEALDFELNLSETLKIEYVCYQNYTEMVADLKNDTIDTAFPVGGNAWDLEQIEIDATNLVLAAGMNLVYKNKYDLNDNGTFAVNKNNRLQYYYIKNNFPKSKIVEYDSIDDCLDAVLKGSVQYTIINGLRVNLYTENEKYSKLSSVQLQKKDNRYFGVNHNETGLLLLLNRGLNIIGTEFAINASYNYISSNRKVNAITFLKEYMPHIAGAIILIVLVVAVLLILYARSMKKNQVIINNNLVEIKNLNKQLQENNILLQEKVIEAEKANAAKTDFLNNMSHDIRTPMNAIMGFTALLSAKKDDPEAIDDYLAKIKVSGDYLLSIINNVLDMARIESGKEQIEEELMNINEEEHNLVVLIEEMAKRKNQTFVSRVNVEHPCILTDVSKIKEIMMNLVSNAIKYTPNEGTIEMSVDELPNDKEGYGTYRLTVKDNGIGMSPEYIEHVFDSFSREKNTTESKVIGTGLGMAIVKKLVDLLGGTIEVQSELHVGTTFIVTMEHEIVDNPEKYTQKKVSSNNSLDQIKGKRLLIAEDNDFNAEITITVLENAGFYADRVCDGVEALKALHDHDADYYAAVLMDIQMPNLNGYDAAKSIRLFEDKEKASIPIIAMTANAFEEDKKKALEMGMNAHLAKPIDVNLLLETLIEVIVNK